MNAGTRDSNHQSQSTFVQRSPLSPSSQHQTFWFRLNALLRRPYSFTADLCLRIGVRVLHRSLLRLTAAQTPRVSSADKKPEMMRTDRPLRLVACRCIDQLVARGRHGAYKGCGVGASRDARLRSATLNRLRCSCDIGLINDRKEVFRSDQKRRVLELGQPALSHACSRASQTKVPGGAVQEDTQYIYQSTAARRNTTSLTLQLSTLQWQPTHYRASP